jgi:hypothetical protein
LQSENLGSPISADQSGRIYFETGRSVRSSVKTVVGQHSRPVSIAARSLRQNSSSCLWRRAIASILPSSTIRFRFDMVSPPSIRVGDAVTRTSSPALAEERVRDFEVLFSPRTPSTSSNVGVFGARPRRSCTEALSRPKRSCVHPPTATHCFWPTRGERDQRHALKLEFNFIRDIAPVADITSSPPGQPIVSGQDRSRTHRLCQSQSGYHHGVAFQRSSHRRAHETRGSQAARPAARAAAGRAAQGDRKTRRGSSARSNSIGDERRKFNQQIIDTIMVNT